MPGLGGKFSAASACEAAIAHSAPIQSLPIPKLRDVPPPSAEYAHNYNQFRVGERFWLASNLTPDFPTAAQEVLNAYKAVGARAHFN